MWNSCERKGMTESGAGGGRQGGTTKLGLGSLVEVSWFCVRGRALCELAVFLRGRERERREGGREMCVVYLFGCEGVGMGTARVW
jgi:hypothetical protein